MAATGRADPHSVIRTLFDATQLRTFIHLMIKRVATDDVAMEVARLGRLLPSGLSGYGGRTGQLPSGAVTVLNPFDRV